MITVRVIFQSLVSNSLDFVVLTGTLWNVRGSSYETRKYLISVLMRIPPDFR